MSKNTTHVSGARAKVSARMTMRARPIARQGTQASANATVVKKADKQE